ncbi:hypothetical protein [Bradyrhizobium phage BDU-MI-1]|nr:hypothetical protein [Bradyrhizobium phage BDU-MI-1]
MSETDSRPSHRAIHLAVRNILFNELGLDRGAIEGLVKQEVTGITSQRFRNLEEVEAWVIRALSQVIYGRYSRQKIEKLIEEQVKLSVNNHVRGIVNDILKDKLKIEITA